MPTVQMNTRIDADLKAAGDEAFKKLGYTPSRVVRAIWSHAARNSCEPDNIKRLLDAAEGPQAGEEELRRKRTHLAEQGPEIFSDYLSAMGVSMTASRTASTLSPAEMREQAALERARMKGWIDG